MSRASNEAETGRPTVEQEMSVFKGFSTNNGETITPDKPEDLNPVTGKNLSAEEAAKAAESKTPGGKTAPAAKTPAKLDDAESEKIIADLDKELGREATEAEISDALKAAADKKAGKEAAPKKSVQERINKSIKAQRAAERETATLRAENAALKAAAKETPLTDVNNKGKDAATDEAPDPKKFEYGELDANYIRALARFEAKQEIADAAKKEQTKTLTAQQQADKTKFEAAKAEFEDAGSELYDDFEEVVMQGARDKAWPLSDTLGAALMTSEHGAQIAYELASDPKEAKRVYELAPMAQVKWLGRREAALEVSAGSGANDGKDGKDGKPAGEQKSKTEKAAVESKAPTPITRVRGQGSASTVPGDTQDFPAFEAAAMGRRTK